MRTGLMLVAAIAVGTPAGSQETVSPTGVFVDMGGYKLNYRDVGDGGVPVVFFHGGGDALGVWDLVIEQLGSTVRSVALDSHGRGYSDWGPRHRTMKQIAHDARGLLDLEGIDGPYLLVGHSLGGLIAQSFARAFPDDVSGMVLVDPTPFDRLGRYGGDEEGYYMARDRDFAGGGEVPELWSPGDSLALPTEEFRRESDYTNFLGVMSQAQVDRLQTATNHSRLKPVGAELNGYWAEELRDLYAAPKGQWLGTRPIRLLYVPADFSDYPAEWFGQSRLTKREAAQDTNESLLAYVRQSADGEALPVDAPHHIQIYRSDLVTAQICEVLRAVGSSC